MKVIYDISVCGLATYRSHYKAGGYRLIHQLALALNSIDEPELIYSHTHNAEMLKFTRKYIEDYRLKGELINRRKFPYPVHTPNHHINRYLRSIYRMAGILPERLLWNNSLLEQADLFHSTFYSFPEKVKTMNHLERVMTVYDLIPILYPNMYGNSWHEQHIEIIKSIGKDYTICISEHTKNDLCNYDPDIDPDRSFVIYPAASGETFYPNNDPEDFKRIRLKYSLPKNYYFSLSSLEPRKNLPHTVKCFFRFIKEENIDDLFLVLSGSKAQQYNALSLEIEKHPELKDRIIYTGRVPDEDLAPLISNAVALLYVSIYEGFGLPPLEAMQCGTPVITSNSSSLPEVVGDAGLMCEPNDEDALCELMFRIYNDGELRKELSDKGLERSKQFSWGKYRDEHVDAYRAICCT